MSYVRKYRLSLITLESSNRDSQQYISACYAHAWFRQYSPALPCLVALSMVPSLEYPQYTRLIHTHPIVRMSSLVPSVNSLFIAASRVERLAIYKILA